jgi:hypothetical protein
VEVGSRKLKSLNMIAEKPTINHGYYPTNNLLKKRYLNMKGKLSSVNFHFEEGLLLRCWYDWLISWLLISRSSGNIFHVCSWREQVHKQGKMWHWQWPTDGCFDYHKMEYDVQNLNWQWPTDRCVFLPPNTAEHLNSTTEHLYCIK